MSPVSTSPLQVRQVEEAEDLVGALEGRLPSTHRAREHRRGPSTAPSGSLTEVERAKQQEGREGGVLPTPWLLGLFAGCMPLPRYEKAQPIEAKVTKSYPVHISKSVGCLFQLLPSRFSPIHIRVPIFYLCCVGRMLELWDVCLLRGDRFLGFFLSLALVLHHKTELLSLQGPALRAAVETLFTNGRTPVLQARPPSNSQSLVSMLERLKSSREPTVVYASFQ